MKKLTPVQIETLEFCKKQIDEARNISLDISKAKKKDSAANKKILDAQNGIVYTQGGNCTIRTLKALEERGLIEILEDNSGIGTGFGAFPTKIKILNY
jgi:peptidase E